MINLRSLVVLVLVCIAFSAARAQESKLSLDELVSQWSSSTDTIVTSAAKQAVANHFGEKLKTDALETGFDIATAQRLSDAVVKNKTAQIYVQGSFGKVLAGDVELMLSQPDQLTKFQMSFLSFSPARPLPGTARIKIVVIPVPPRDYHVVINDEPLQTTEASVYSVSPGEVRVLVTRTGRKDCAWRDMLVDGDERNVKCHL